MISFVKQLFLNLRFADFLDISVVAVFLYFTFTWLRKKASRSIVIGIGSVLFLYAIARFFNMYMTSMVFQAGLTASLVMLVIIFQEDIRMVIERLATIGRFQSRHQLIASNKTVEALVESVCNLARDKIGALIVIKGKESLDRHLNGGISLTGRMSVPLMYSIFHPATPSHDGALIIEGDKIDKFAVRLPLSHNLEEVKELGTRHTAAVGISERSDAIVLVVSEERGTISIAEEGHLEIVDETTLRKRLNSFYSRLSPPPAEITRFSWFTHNAGIKTLSFVTALLLWIFIASKTDTVNRTVAVPVEYKNVPSGWQLEDPQPSEFKITLSGPERSFNFDQSSLVASIDLGKIKDGYQSVPVTESSFNLPSGIGITTISPKQFSFRAYRVEQVDLPVKIKTRGKPPKSLEISEIKSTPPTLKVILPVSKKSSVTELSTEPLDLMQIDQNTALRLRVITPSGVSLTDENQNTVKVSVTLTGKKD